MRKTSYVVAFFAVTFTLILNILSAVRHDWLVVKTDVAHVKTIISYGLMERCQVEMVELPSPHGHFQYRDSSCRPFPTHVADRCKEENRLFCTAWITAGYLTELGAGFAGVALFALLIGVSTHSRRRRIWKAVVWLITFHALLQIVAFTIVTRLYQTSQFPTFENAMPSTAYIMNIFSWAFAVIIALGVVTTGVSANKGHRWAAGNRAYYPIHG